MNQQLFKFWGCVLAITFSILGVNNIEAQTTKSKNSILLQANGKETLLEDVTFVADSAYRWHEVMLYHLNEKVVSALPTEAKEVVRAGKRYLSVEIQQDGETKRIFALLDMEDKEHSIRVFQRLLASGEKEKYVQFNDGTLQYVDDSKGKSNPLRNHLLKENAAKGGDPQIAEYINKVKAESSDIKECYSIIASQNPYRIPRWRFGVSGGMTSNNFEVWIGEIRQGANYDAVFPSQSAVNPWIALYADYRMSNGLSARAELSMQRNSLLTVSNDQVHDTIDIDRTILCVPVMLRYTMVNLRGRFLPYVEAGLQVNIALTNKNRHMAGERNGSSKVTYTERYGENNGISYPKPALGVGFEFVLTPKRSLYLGARYLLPDTHETGRRINVKQNTLLVTLSVDLF